MRSEINIILSLTLNLQFGAKSNSQSEKSQTNQKTTLAVRSQNSLDPVASVAWRLCFSCVLVFRVFQRRNVHLLLSVLLLAVCGAVLLACRLYWMGNKPPNFSNSDNPAADSPSLLTRTLTFLYLPAVNLWLLLCPNTLSFDWSMDAVPLIRGFGDWRNLHSVAFYVCLVLLAWTGLRTRQAKSKETNGKAHCVTNGKSATNGHGYHPPEQEHTNSHAEPHSCAQNGTKKHHAASRMPLPTTENVVVFSLGLLAIPFLPATNLFFYVGFVVAEIGRASCRERV